jgi:glycerol uptake facilitator-like aquaporin
LQEIIGSFIFVFFYLTQTEKRNLSLTKEKAINCLVIAAAFTSARAIVFGQWTDQLLVHTGSGNLRPTGLEKSQISVSDYSLIYPATNNGACLNPAIALAVALVSPMQSEINRDESDPWAYLWLYPIMPFVGTALAVLYYEFVFKKAENMIED